ncbi:hypothetical protein FKP32DRAFT_1560999 [Trametes sanguinea]|nr:hypothetical protein FKP32DRAFT_1560999 [Trametes sanguinea]
MALFPLPLHAYFREALSTFNSTRSVLPGQRLSAVFGLPAVFSLRQPEVSSQVHRIVDAAVQQALRAHIGPRDYALAIDGALIVPGLTTSAPHLQNSVRSNLPEVILRDNLEGGRCWSLGARRGQVGIALPSVILPTHFTIDHIPSEVAEDIGQAPRNVLLWGALDGRLNEQKYLDYAVRTTGATSAHAGPSLTQGYTFVLLANATYNIHLPSFVQRFPLDETVRASGMSFGVFVIEVVDNWGSDAACLYRIRIHGTTVDN